MNFTIETNDVSFTSSLTERAVPSKGCDEFIQLSCVEVSCRGACFCGEEWLRV
jgi:hypothetical protein